MQAIYAEINSLYIHKENGEKVMVDFTVRKGDSPWTLAAAGLGEGATQQEIAKQVAKLPSIYGCSSMKEFQQKYFYSVGKTIEIKFGSNPQQQHEIPQPQKDLPSLLSSGIFHSDTTLPCDAIPDTNRFVRQQHITDTPRVATDSLDHIPPSLSESDFQRLLEIPTKDWRGIKGEQDRINNLATDKERIIEYNRTIGHPEGNYVIVDKKNFTATVYTPDGQVVKEYEVGVAKNESDALLRRSKRNPQNDIAATSAGIYTANYRATGRDGYRRLYNNRVLTLSNDGLRERGVGNGETGVAFHQVPNGNLARKRKLNAPGATPENNRFSSGCVNFLPEDFDDCMRNIDGVGTKVYILPEDENNYMNVKNGQLQFSQRVYTGDVATTTTKNNPVKNIRISPKSSDMRQEGIDMAQTLSAQKKTLARELGLDNDTYNDLAMLTLGIAGQETRYGDPYAGLSDGKPYWAKENMGGVVDFVKGVLGNNSYDSRGITQMKLSSYTDPEVKRLFEQYGINEDNLSDGSKASIATMIVLSCMYKNELPALRDRMKEQNLTVQDALLYCWQNRKSQITGGTATPDKSTYHRNVRRFMDNFSIYQSAA